MLLVKDSPLSESSKLVLLLPGGRIHLWFFTQGQQCCFAHAARCIRRRSADRGTLAIATDVRALCEGGDRGTGGCDSVLRESKVKSKKGIDKGGRIV